MSARSRFWRGETLEILEASPHRRPHVWRQADVEVPPESRPGGADFGHIELSHQRTLKREVLTDALKRFGGVDVPVGSGRPASSSRDTADGTGWRTRVSLHVDDHGRVGPFAARSHTVVPVEDYPLATAGVQRTPCAAPAGSPAASTSCSPPTAACASSTAPIRRSRAPPESREVVTERVGEREFRVDAGGFWQVHRLAAETLDAAVRAAVGTAAPEGPDPDAWHLDLYGGVGLFAAALAELGRHRVTSSSPTRAPPSTPAGTSRSGSAPAP